MGMMKKAMGKTSAAGGKLRKLSKAGKAKVGGGKVKTLFGARVMGGSR